jgi:hypothetical protein
MSGRNQEDAVVHDALRITITLNKHLSEHPECCHTVKEIASEAFNYDDYPECGTQN